MDRHKDSAFNNHRSSAAHGPSRDGNQRMTHMAGPRLAPGSGQEILDVNRHRDGEASSRRSSAAHGPSGDGNRRMTHMAGPRLAPGSGQEILDVNRHRDGEASNHRSSAVHGSTRDRNQEVLVAAQHSSAALRLQNVTDSVRLAVRTDPHTPSHTDEDIQHNQPDIHGALSRSATDSVSHHGTTSIQSAQNTRVDIQPAYGYAHQNRRQSDRRDKTSVQSSQPGASSALHSTTTQRTSVHTTTASSERTRSYEDRNKPQSHSVMQSGQESNVGGPARNEERHTESCCSITPSDTVSVLQSPLRMEPITEQNSLLFATFRYRYSRLYPRQKIAVNPFCKEEEREVVPLYTRGIYCYTLNIEDIACRIPQYLIDRYDQKIARRNRRERLVQLSGKATERKRKRGDTQYPREEDVSELVIPDSEDE
jgi:hypothetical protein